jgi:hypothetical protein
MGRKVFQDYANVLCQRFLESPTNRDLVNLVVIGGGLLELDILKQRASCDHWPVDPLPYCGEAKRWLNVQLAKRAIADDLLVAASLVVKYTFTSSRRLTPVIPYVTFVFDCYAEIAAPDRTYTSRAAATKSWGLGSV